MSTISAISSNDPLALQSVSSQPKKDLQSLANDLSSGNLASAQKDFASFQQDVSNAFQSLNNSTGGTLPLAAMAGGNGPAGDLQALQSALSSNNLSAAQQDFATFQQDVQGFGAHRGHHHHKATGDQDSQDSQTSGTNGTTGTTTGATNGTNNVPDYTMAAMLAAYKAFGGGLTSATSTMSAVG